MKTKFGLIPTALVAAALMACGDDSSSTNPNNEPLSSASELGVLSSSDAGLVPGLSSAEILPVSSATVPTSSEAVPGSSAVIPGSSATDPIINIEPLSSGVINPVSSATIPASSATVPAVSSSSVASSSSVELGPTEKTYAFGYALKNAARPSKGCGKDPVLKGTIAWSCDKPSDKPSLQCDAEAQQFSIKVNASGEDRTYYMTFPSNYDKTKPYKLLFANHCMGSSSNHMATWIKADQDHPSPYYAQKAQDTEGNYIFVAPQGESSGMWTKGEKDHQFISELLTHIEDNYCIDESRVFMTGFSFGAMFSNSLAQTFQSRVRAVAVYAVADYNIYLPDNAGKPIAWMAVHGTNDGMCDYNRAKNSAVKRILKNNGKASDGDSQFTDASSEDVPAFNGSNHQCYDFTKVDERFPVKFCSWSGQHQWTANDSWNNDWGNSWVPGEVHKFFEQF